MNHKMELTSRQVKLITALSVIIVGIIGVVLFKVFELRLKINTVNDFALVVIMLFTMAYIVGMAVYYSLDYHVEKREKDFEAEKLKRYVNKHLNVDYLTQVYLAYSSNSDREKMIAEIFKNGEYKFSAMLLINGTILIYVEDKEGKTVYMTGITNYQYFVNNFTFNERKKSNVQ